ncbi:MAG TPA: heme o synthase [Longimicrobiales bacterium]|nr:heme o synthase [Longimicrobiales bacterium]
MPASVRAAAGIPSRPAEGGLVRRKARAYTTLTKPGITVFITLAAAAAYLVAAGGVAPGLLALAAATALASAGAATLNQYLERDADARMRRTALRPLPAGDVSPREALGVGVALSAAGLALSALTLPLPATLLLAASHASYVALYTPLKRLTPLCTLAGALPGALPVLAGWSATGAPLDATAWGLAGVLYLWQLPHFLAIGWLCREDYRRGGFRVLAVFDADGRRTGRQSTLYAAALLPVSLLPALAGPAGPLYLLLAATLGAAYLLLSVDLLRRPDTARARRLFFASLAYLPLLLLVLVGGTLLG